ncbi:MAG TPA: HNH endonuclease, partial [Phycisphaerales bacterium]|nr:HNH endonuclease [Phycisphaerales bacterium]
RELSKRDRLECATVYRVGQGRQLPAYRFIFCVLNEGAAGCDDVVRHRCNNRRCINPEHLEIGSRGENLQDERDFSANGVDFGLL